MKTHSSRKARSALSQSSAFYIAGGGWLHGCLSCHSPNNTVSRSLNYSAAMCTQLSRDYIAIHYQFSPSIYFAGWPILFIFTLMWAKECINALMYLLTMP